MLAVQIGTFDGYGADAFQQGPYVDSTGAFFVVLINHTTHVLEMWSSSDSGATWNELDAGHRPSTSTSGANPLGTCFSGDVITMVYLGTDGALGGSNINLITFNCIAGTWGVNFNGGPTQDFGGTIEHSLQVAQRSNGDRVVVFMLSVDGNTFDNAAFAIHNGAGWSGTTNFSPSLTAENYAFGVVLGASDRVHVFTGGDATGNVWHMTINANNTTGPIRLIATNFENPSFDFASAQPWFDGTNLYISLVNATTQEVVVYSAVETIDPNPWTASDTGQNLQNIENGFGMFGTFLQNVVVQPAGTLNVFLVSGANANEIVQYTNSGSGWSPGTLIYTTAVGTVLGSIAALPLSATQIGLFWNEGPQSSNTPGTAGKFILIGGKAPHPELGYTPLIDQNQLGFIALPNPAKRCDEFGPQRCIPVLKKRILRGKTYTHVRLGT